MKLGIVDMEANFVPGSRNQLNLTKEELFNIKPIERLEKAVEIIKKSEFGYVELGIPWINDFSLPVSSKEVRELLTKYNIKVNAYCSLMPKEIPVVGPDSDIKKIETYLEKVFYNCNQNGGGIVVFGSGDSRNIPKSYGRKQAEGDIINFLDLSDKIIKKITIH